MYSFIVNPNSNGGRGEKIWRQLEKRLRRLGVEYEAFITEKPGDASAFAASLTERCKEPKIIVVVGGDGTINEVLDGLSFCGQVTLGYIPVAADSDLARSLKLPKRPSQCLKKILNPKYHKLMDYGVISYGEQLNHRRFMVSAGIGMDAAMHQDISEFGMWRRLSRLHLGRLGRIAVGLRCFLFTWPTKGYMLIDGVQRVEFNHIYFVSAHMHPYEGGGFRIAPTADPSDGKLTVSVVHNARKRKVFALLVSAFLKKGGKRHGIRYYTCQEVDIHLERQAAVHVDGENCMPQKDIHVRCIPQKVRMIV